MSTKMNVPQVHVTGVVAGDEQLWLPGHWYYADKQACMGERA
jgi:hypothetical protein